MWKKHSPFSFPSVLFTMKGYQDNTHLLRQPKLDLRLLNLQNWSNTVCKQCIASGSSQQKHKQTEITMQRINQFDQKTGSTAPMLQLCFFFPTGCRQDTPALPCSTQATSGPAATLLQPQIHPLLSCTGSLDSFHLLIIGASESNCVAWVRWAVKDARKPCLLIWIIGVLKMLKKFRRVSKSGNDHYWEMLPILSFHTPASCGLKSSGSFQFLALEGIVWASFKDAHSSSSLAAFSFPYRGSYCLGNWLRI